MELQNWNKLTYPRNSKLLLNLFNSSKLDNNKLLVKLIILK